MAVDPTFAIAFLEDATRRYPTTTTVRSAFKKKASAGRILHLRETYGKLTTRLLRHKNVDQFVVFSRRLSSAEQHPNDHSSSTISAGATTNSSAAM